MTLLEEAKKIKRTTKLGERTPEEIELILAWLRSEISVTQVTKVTEMAHGGFYAYALLTLRQAYKEGKLEIKKA